MKAWVITRETPNANAVHNTVVVGLLSARKSAEAVKDYVEWLYVTLECSTEDLMGFVKYSKPYKPYEAQYFTTNTGVSHKVGMYCGHNPFLIARLADNVNLKKNGWLEWGNPEKFVVDSKTLDIKEKLPGSNSTAPVCLQPRKWAPKK